ncbi:oligopeptide:H+ symporter [Streptomyces sp. CT34]|uniref:peptide MFS transporter n=1 Tax=Streptomyces sp. CT34 TaxID=1553907 RepID=UPI0012FF508D|nr:oligopeptide:H+ symporter [Streptomyces sp. CT34]
MGTLLAVDLWERFSFYGMAAILVLYLTSSTGQGGLGMAPQIATTVFAGYMSLSFLAGLPGGWLADRVLGARRSILLGGCLISCGHAVLAAPWSASLYGGLLLLVIGTGLVKPAMAALVAMLTESNKEREAAFSLFYLYIQVSALIAPVATGLVAEKVSWHLGFAVAALGMAIGLLQFTFALGRFGDLGQRPLRPIRRSEATRVLRRSAPAVLVVGVLVAVAALAGSVSGVLTVLGLATLSLPFGYLALLRRGSPWTGRAARRQLSRFTMLMASSAAFWMVFAQSGSVLNLFAEHHTDRHVLGFEVPASWFQSVHPAFVLVAAPIVARLWRRLGPQAEAPVKFAAGLMAGGFSFLLMAAAALIALRGPVGPYWLLLAYLLYAVGELSLAPAAMVLAAEVAPPGATSQFLALNGLFGAVGVVLGGQLFRLTAIVPLPLYFLSLGILVIAVAVAVGLSVDNLRIRTHPGD